MEEIKVGEYCRTKNGIIFKVDKDKMNLDINEFVSVRGDRVITKHSENIIDLIEVGDYVNGCNVVDIKNDGVVVSGGFGEIWLSQIENIVTREQFELAKYEVI